jgi:hypothetical protein
MTPALKAGIAEYPMTIEDIVKMPPLPVVKKRGPYKKRVGRRRRGRFVVLRESVITSGRKLRAYSAREILVLLARLAFTGPRALRRREGLDVWYGERRNDPGGPAEPSAAPRGRLTD